MNKYVSPIAEVIGFSTTDIILTSGGRPPIVEGDDYDASAASVGNTPV